MQNKPSPNSPCEGCAFGQSGAAKETANALKGQICVLGAVPFWCHHTTNGEEWEDTGLGVLGLPPGKRRLCAGWKREVKRVASSGYYKVLYGAKRTAAMNALTGLDAFTDRDDPAIKRWGRMTLRRAMITLNHLRRGWDW